MYSQALGVWWIIGIFTVLLAFRVNKKKLSQNDVIPIMVMGILGPGVAVLWAVIYYLEEHR